MSGAPEPGPQHEHTPASVGRYPHIDVECFHCMEPGWMDKDGVIHWGRWHDPLDPNEHRE